jgi:CMP-N-acetylneuraminic acid synthetase
MEVLCIIPARGGSKGIPYKNIISIAGQPLLSWTIEVALGSKNINRTIVSTDDVEIAGVAREYGAEVVMRPDEISGDLASSEDALLHVIESLQRDEGYVAELVVFMQCTSPLTRSEDLDKAIQLLLQTGSDVVFSAAQSHAFLWRIDEKGLAIGVNHGINHRPMRQQKPPEYQETGAFYVFRASGFRTHCHRFFGKIMLYEMPPERSMDIDEPWEVPIAELLMRSR